MPKTVQAAMEKQLTSEVTTVLHERKAGLLKCVPKTVQVAMEKQLTSEVTTVLHACVSSGSPGAPCVGRSTLEIRASFSYLGLPRPWTLRHEEKLEPQL